MAVTVTAKSVRPLPGAITRRFTPAATMTAGMCVYITSGGKIGKAIASASGTYRGRGVVVADSDGSTSFGTSDKVDVCVFGPLAGFSSLAEGTPHYVDASTAGKITGTAPTASGTYAYAIGEAESTSVLFIQPQITAATVNAS